MERDARIELAREPWQGPRLPLHQSREINNPMKIPSVQEIYSSPDLIPRREPPKPPPSEASLLSSTPEEIKRNIERWREFNERIHVVV